MSEQVKHPAKYTDVLLPVMAQYLHGYKRILDPMAGVGGIFKLYDYLDDDVVIMGIELEPEWVNAHPRVMQGDALHLNQFEDGFFDAIVVSPGYANRMSDKLSKGKWAGTRISYADSLGRDLSPGNGAALQWGDKYRDLHEDAWVEAARVLRPDGRFVLNIKDHYRNYQRQYVTDWHIEVLCSMGFSVVAHEKVKTKGMRRGENHALRIDYESVVVLDRLT